MTASYSRVNFKDIDDVAIAMGRSPGMEGRRARGPWLDLEQMGISYFRFAAGARSPFTHGQKTQEEVYVLISGHATMKIADEFVSLVPLDAVRVSPGVPRAIEGGRGGAELIIAGAPYNDGTDGYLVPDPWTDEPPA